MTGIDNAGKTSVLNRISGGKQNIFISKKYNNIIIKIIKKKYDNQVFKFQTLVKLSCQQLDFVQ